MSKSIISATYSDLKTVKSRGVVQIVLEMPIEGMAEAFGLLGAPLPGNEVWVAVARLRSKPEALEALSSVTATVHELDPPHKAKPLSQVAAYLCTIVAFRRFLAERVNRNLSGEGEAADALRDELHIVSRRELDSNPEAAAAFRDLKASYDLWLRDAA